MLSLRGTDARPFLVRTVALDAAGLQLALAKVTGNFKHGKERRTPIVLIRHINQIEALPIQGRATADDERATQHRLM